MLTYTFQYQHYYSFKDTSLYCIPGCVDVKQNFNCTFKVFKVRNLHENIDISVKIGVTARGL